MNDQNYLGCQYHTLNSVVFVQECLPNLLLSLAIGNLHLVAWTLFLACMVWVLFQYQFFFFQPNSGVKCFRIDLPSDFIMGSNWFYNVALQLLR